MSEGTNDPGAVPPGGPPAGGAGGGAPPGGGAAPGTPTRAAVAAQAMPPGVLAERLKREREAERKKVLAELGVEDPTAFKSTREKDAAELAELRKATDERKRAELSEIDKHKRDLETAQRERDEAREQLAHERTQRDLATKDAGFREKAAEFVAAPYVKLARVEFAEYVRSLPEKMRDKLTPGDQERWFRGWVKKNPTFALAAPPPGGAAPAAKPGVVKRPIANGAPPRRVTPPNGQDQPGGDSPGYYKGKRVKAGFPDSMNAAELREYAKSQNMPQPR